MNKEEQSFREKYKYDTRRDNSVKTFKKLIKRSVNDEITEIWLKAMATINLEMERKFANNNIRFAPPAPYSQNEANTFSLIERRKSKRSTKKKKKENISKFDEKFEQAIESGSEIPQNVRHIFDLYGLKLICPNVDNPQLIIITVIQDILSDIEESHPEFCDQVQTLKNNLNYMSINSAVDFITENFSDRYPNLKERINQINADQKQANAIQTFLSSTSSNVSSLTNAEYYELIIKCQKALLELSYDDGINSTEKENEDNTNAKKPFNERESIEENIAKLQNKLNTCIENGEGSQLIKKSDFKRFSSALTEQLNMVAQKRTNKLDLSVGDLMFYDVITTSKALRNAGITWSDDISRNKLKRNSNGYAANFYSLDGPNGIHAEIQVQSFYRYHYGEIGPAAHNKMPGKKIVLYSPKKHHRKKWFRKLADAIPRRSICMGNGEIKINNIHDDFYEQYKPRTDLQLEIYRRFMKKQFKNIYRFINAYRENRIKYQFNKDFSEVEKVSEQELTPDYIENSNVFNNSVNDVLDL